MQAVRSPRWGYDLPALTHQCISSLGILLQRLQPFLRLLDYKRSSAVLLRLALSIDRWGVGARLCGDAGKKSVRHQWRATGPQVSAELCSAASRGV